MSFARQSILLTQEDCSLAYRLGPHFLKARHFITEIGGFVRHRFSSVDIGTRAKDPVWIGHSLSCSLSCSYSKSLSVVVTMFSISPWLRSFPLV
jgi:hypothetical protein